jgi:hypothetical protein
MLSKPVAINDILERFTVIVTSSGGGGHLVAAKNLQETLLEQAAGLAVEMVSFRGIHGRPFHLPRGS